MQGGNDTFGFVHRLLKIVRQKHHLNMKKKILIIASEPATGMQHFAVSIYKLLQESLFVDIFLLTQNKSKSDYWLHINQSHHVKHIDYPNNLILRLMNKIIPYKIILAFRRIVESEGIIDVHLITGDYSLWLFVFFVYKRYNLYYTVHDLIPHETYSGTSLLSKLFNKYLYMGERVIRECSQNLMTCSFAQYNALIQKYPSKNNSFVHFPSLINAYMINGNLKVIELNKEKDYILFFGRVDFYKGVDVLVNAYLKSDIKNKLVIAGYGTTDLQNDNRIIRINRFIRDEEIKDLFSKASVIVLPYRSVTMSGVFSIAMYFKKRIIASDISFFLEYKNPCITYFKTEDVDSLSAAIIETLANKKDINDVYPLFYSDSLIRNEMELFYNNRT